MVSKTVYEQMIEPAAIKPKDSWIILRASDVMKSLECPEKVASFSLFEDAERYDMERTLLKECLALLKKGATYEYVAEYIATEGQRKLNLLNLSPYEKARVIDFETKLLKRVFSWLYSVVTEVIELSVPTEYYYGKAKISSKVDMIYRAKDGLLYALVLSLGKASRGSRSKEITKSVFYDLGVLVSKAYLEEQYPGIQIVKTYLKADKENYEHFSESVEVGLATTKQVHIYEFAGKLWTDFLDEDGILNQLSFDDRISEIMNAKPAHNCDKCLNLGTCQSETLEDALKELPSLAGEVSFSMKGLSDEQLAVTEQMSGNMVVCSGPGAGKTKSLVARTVNLLDENKGDVPFCSIFIIAFENKAVDEIKQRLLSVGIDEDLMPTVCTIDSLCYQMCIENADVLGYVPQILTASKQESILRELCSTRIRYSEDGTLLPPVKGVTGTLDGRNGALATLKGAISSYEKGSATDFEKSYPKLDMGDFLEFFNTYSEVLQEKHLLTYEGINSLVVTMLETSPAILKAYQSNFSYLMVDEYQDLSEIQHKLVMLLWGEGKAGNSLFAFGDDDQNIFSFRGGSSKYMLELSNRDDFSTVLLSNNYRSCPEIISASENIIEGARKFDKRMKACGKKGRSVNAISAYKYEGPAQLEQLINSLVEEGYSYGDIAVISSKNSELETLRSSVAHIPSVLSKRVLTETCLVQVLYNLNKVVFEYSELAMAKLIKAILGKGELYELSRYGLGSLIAYVDSQTDKYPLIKNLLEFTRDSSNYQSLRQYVGDIASMLGLGTSLELRAISDALVNECGNEEASFDLYCDTLEELVVNDKETHISVEQKDRVMFITAHSAKGMEFPAVIYHASRVKNIEKKKPVEDWQKALYVAVTRAKERLIVVGDDTGYFED